MGQMDGAVLVDSFDASGGDDQVGLRPLGERPASSPGQIPVQVGLLTSKV